MATRDFLKDYQNVLLRQIIMPGSHDAGLADESYESMGLFGTRRIPAHCPTSFSMTS
jgi:hypothetical protein